MKTFGFVLAVVVLAAVFAVGAASSPGQAPQPPGQPGNPTDPSDGAKGGANPPSKGSNPKPTQPNPGNNPPNQGDRPRPQSGAKGKPARPTRPPHRLWYRITLNVTETGAWEESQDHLKWKAVWGADSSSAVIVENVCRVGRRTIQDRCSYAFRGRHRPAGAFDDLAFEAGVNGEYLKLDFESVRQAFEVIEPPGLFGSDVVRCTSKTTTIKVSKPALYRGTLSSGSLVRTGLGISIQYPARLPGELTGDVGSQTCTREIARPLGDPPYSIVNTSSPSHDTWPFLGAPWEVQAGAFVQFVPAVIGPELKLPSAAGKFGSSFTIRKTLKKPYTGQQGTVEANVSLVFTLCPRGGRNVKPC